MGKLSEIAHNGIGLDRDFAIKAENSARQRFWKMVDEITRERRRQDEKFGVQAHDDEWWLAILMEEVGEAAQAILQKKFDNSDPRNAHVHVFEEVVQCAAVCVAWMECIERETTHGARGDVDGIQS